MASKMVIFADPEDPEVVKAIGVVALRHARLDYVLRMMVKSLGGLPLDEGLKITFRSGSNQLRDRIKKLARKRLGAGNALIRLEATLKECENATARRNEIMHSIVVREVDGNGGVMMRNDDYGSKPLPSPEELRGLAMEVTKLEEELNEARLHGYLNEAMTQRPAV